MATTKPQKTTYPGVFFRMARRLGKTGEEKVFYVKWKKNGKTYEEKAGRQYADDMTPAKASRIRGDLIEGKIKSKADLRKEGKVERLTISKLWERYVKSKTIKGIVQDKNRYENYLEKPFGNKEPDQILPQDIDDLLNDSLKGKSPQTRKHVLSLLGRITKYGADYMLTTPLRFNLFKLFKIKIDNVKIEYLTDDEKIALTKACQDDPHPQAGTMLLLALFTGMRRGEIFKLKWKDVNFNTDKIAIKKPKGGKSTSIPLNEVAKELLQDYAKSQDIQSEFVFPGKDGEMRTNIAKQVVRIKEAAKLPDDFRPFHGLRHTFATDLINAGLDPFTLQKLLNHADIKTTMRYAHFFDKAAKEASSKFAEIYKKAMNGN